MFTSNEERLERLEEGFKEMRDFLTELSQACGIMARAGEQLSLDIVQFADQLQQDLDQLEERTRPQPHN